jgi:flagellar motor switch protein FliN/FliY
MAERAQRVLTMKDPQKNLSLLLDVELPLTISFGRTCMPLRDVLKLSTGSVIELDCAIDEPVSIMVNNRLIARGSAVVIDGNYGVRIDEVVGRQEWMQLEGKTGENAPAA